MATDRGRPARRRTVFGILLAAGLVAWTGGPRPAFAIVPVGPNTEVRSIDFTGVESLPERDLRHLLRTRSRGTAFGLRVALGKLPLVPSPARHPFHPLTLQEDVVRMRNAYAAAGFLETVIRYDVRRAENEDVLDITFRVEEGRPQRVVDVTIEPADGAPPLPVPEEERASWEDVRSGADRLAGRPLSLASVLEQRKHMEDWWRNRGFWLASVHSQVERDSTRAEGRIRFVVEPGPRGRFGAVSVQGNRAVADDTLSRRMPFRPGDTYSSEAMAEAEQELQGLEIVHGARVTVAPPDPFAESGPAVLPVQVAVEEKKPRLVAGQFGYVTNAGLSVEAEWSHLSFLGGGRVLTLSGLAQTGALAAVRNPDRRHRATLSLQQPHVLHRRVSAVVSPFVERSEDAHDVSREVGSGFALVYRASRVSSASIDYQLSSRRILEYRTGELLSGNVDLLTFTTQVAQGLVDSLGSRLATSLVTLSMTAGTIDDLANPRSGVVLRPSIAVTAPTAWSSESYWRPDCEARAFVPLTDRSMFAGRIDAGRVFPFGQSLPRDGEIGALAFLRLRDASFTAGGGGDVRGWSSGLLGPKFPDARFVQQGDSLGLRADGYVPLGGLARVSFSAELRLPFPGLGPHFGSHLFVDGGRVWTSDTRFRDGGDDFREQRFFYAAGAGIDVRTPVGAMRVSLGYKLNPAITDLVDAGELLDAVLAGTSTDAIERHQIRRWQWNLAIGASY